MVNRRRCTRDFALLLLVIALTCWCGRAGGAVNETPKGHKYYVFAPYYFQADRGETVFWSHVRIDYEKAWAGPPASIHISVGNPRLGRERADRVLQARRQRGIVQRFNHILEALASDGTLIVQPEGGYSLEP